ncbi:hypothetical protein [Reyranella sp.]|uniref:hypothetical protein n=1 Tax=Reyranella sp. TaxID=1929291 RepID=UPI0037839382
MAQIRAVVGLDVSDKVDAWYSLGVGGADSNTPEGRRGAAELASEHAARRR